MNGDKGGTTDWLNDGTRVSLTNYDPVDREAFVIQTWIQQGLHDIAANFDDDGNLVVSHSLKLNPNFYEVRWYLDGEEQTQSINASSITVPDDDSFVSIGYRVVNVKEDGHVQVVDAIEVFDDVHDSIHSTYPGQWHCDSFKDVSNLWDGLTVRTYCKSGLYFVFKGGSSSYWPGYARTVSEVKARNDISYVFERSGRGAQIIIDLANFGG